MSLARSALHLARIPRRCHFSSIVPKSSSTLLDKALTKLKNTFLPNYGPLEPIVLYDALHCDEFWEDDWMSTSDKSYGGPSHATLTYGVDSQSNSGDNISEDAHGSGNRTDGHGNASFHGFPFMRFEGSVDMSTRKSQELGVSGGFCAIRYVYMLLYVPRTHNWHWAAS